MFDEMVRTVSIKHETASASGRLRSIRGRRSTPVDSINYCTLCGSSAGVLTTLQWRPDITRAVPCHIHIIRIAKQLTHTTIAMHNSTKTVKCWALPDVHSRSKCRSYTVLKKAPRTEDFQKWDICMLNAHICLINKFIS